MSTKWFQICIVCLLLLTIALPVWHHFGMRTRLTIDGAGGYPVRAYDDRDRGGASVASLERMGDAAVLRCRLVIDYRAPYCALHIGLGAGTHGLDLSRYATVTLDIAAFADTGTGAIPAPVSVYLRNYDPAYANFAQPDTLKANTYQYTPIDGREPLSVPLANFHVAAWWVQIYHVSLTDARPDLHNVVALDVTTGDFLRPGNYSIAVHAITFRGKWLTRDQLLTLIVGMWFSAAMLSLAASVWRARRTASAATATRRELERVNASLSSQRDELRSAASHDALTGAFNRPGLRAHLAPELERAATEGHVLSVVFLDVDRFKLVNDRHGHAVGDACLQQLSALIASHIRVHDLFARWGGEEFLLACVGDTLAPTADLAERLRGLIAGAAWPRGIALSCSFGVAELAPGETFDELLRRADAALYEAKRAGRNRVQVATHAAPAER